MRFNDFAEPNEYYYALINICAGGVDGAAGIAPGTPGPTKGNGPARVSTGVWTSLGSASGTFVHEVGHNQGRPHAPCGGPDGPDPNYPYANARIGAWGFDIVGQQFKNPNNYVDYMSYCNPDWVSDYNYSLIHNQVRILTSWDYEAPEPDLPVVEQLHGLLREDGTEQWWTIPDFELDPELFVGGEQIVYYDDDGIVIENQPMVSWTLEDGKTTYVLSTAPEDLDLVDSAVRITNDMDFPLAVGTIDRIGKKEWR
jgi:hypothetical protein